MKIEIVRRIGLPPNLRLVPETEAEKFQLAHVLEKWAKEPPSPDLAGHAGLYIVVKTVESLI